MATGAGKTFTAITAAFSGRLVPQDATDEPASLLLERVRAARPARPAKAVLRGRKPKVTA